VPSPGTTGRPIWSRAAPTRGSTATAGRWSKAGCPSPTTGRGCGRRHQMPRSSTASAGRTSSTAMSTSATSWAATAPRAWKRTTCPQRAVQDRRLLARRRRGHNRRRPQLGQRQALFLPGRQVPALRHHARPGRRRLPQGHLGGVAGRLDRRRGRSVLPGRFVRLLLQGL